MSWDSSRCPLRWGLRRAASDRHHNSNPHAVDTFDKMPFPEESKVKICGPNWERLYKIPLVKHT